MPHIDQEQDDPEFKYWAFISYSHKDRKWGDWLHKAIETYKVPEKLEAAEHRGGEIPKRLFPVFRDREELPTSADLGRQINEALRQSRYLIVICSPHSAKSIWVNEEIKTFKAMGREHLVLPLIIGGEPNATDKPESGLEECFPEALRYRVDAQRQILSERTEPIAADARDCGDGKRKALVKLLAGLLGVGFDTLWDREQERSRHRMIVGGVLSLALLLFIAGFLGWIDVVEYRASTESSKAQRHEETILATQAEALADLGHAARIQHDWGAALIHYTRSLERFDNFAARIGVEDTLSRFIPELAEFHSFATGSFYGSLSFSPDGRSLAWGSAHPWVSIWDLQTGRVTERTFAPQGDAAFAASYCRNGTLVSTGTHDYATFVSEDGSIATSPELREFTGAATTATITHDGRLLATGFRDGTVRVWDLTTGKRVALLRGHGDVVWALAFSPDRKVLATGSLDKTLCLWDPKTGRKLATLKGPDEPVWAVAFSPDGKYVAAGADNLHIWDVRTARLLATLQGHDEAVLSVAFSPDGTRLASGGGDRTVRLWDPLGGRELAVLRGHEEVVRSVAFSPDGMLLASASDENSVRLWDLRTTWRRPALQGHEQAVLAVAVSSDGRTVASGSADHTVRTWDAESGRALSVFRGHQDVVSSVAFSPEGERIAPGSYDQTARIWNAETGAMLVELKGAASPVLALAFQRDKERVATGSGDNTIRIWDPASGAELARYGHRGSKITALAYSPDGDHLAVVGGSSSITILDPMTGEDRTIGEGPMRNAKEIRAVAYSMDRTHMAYGTDDGVIRILDVQTGLERRLLLGHVGAVTAVAFSPSGRFLASGGEDRTVRVWDAETGKVLAVLNGHADNVTSVAFGPADTLLASGSLDRSVRIWGIDRLKGDLLDQVRSAGALGLSYELDAHGQPVAKDKDALTVARIDAASRENLAWRENGGIDLLPLLKGCLVHLPEPE